MVNKVRNFLIMVKNLQKIHLKLKKIILKTVEVTGDIAKIKKITKVSISLLQNNSETNTNEYGKEIPKEIYISRRKIKLSMISD